MAELLENNFPNNVLLPTETIESLVFDSHYLHGIAKMLQTAKGTKRTEDGKTRILRYT